MNLDIRKAIHDLGLAFGVSDLQLDEEGFGCLATDDYEICFLEEAAERTLLMFARICDLPSEPDAAFLTMLLEGNFFTRETAGATLGIDVDRGWVLLSRAMAIEDMDQARLQEAAVGFIEATDYWSMKVLDYFEGNFDDMPQTPARAASPALAIRG